MRETMHTLVLIITGSRHCRNAELVERELFRIRDEHDGPFGVILGDEPNGVDQIAWEWAKRNGVHIVKRCLNDGNWPSAGPRRNADMVATGQFCVQQRCEVRFVAFWDGRREKSGTLDCMSQCALAKFRGEMIPV